MRPKENAPRSKLYRQLAAAMPCAHCEVWGHSQAAHPPPNGKGIKQSDLEVFPLCAVRVGVAGCHADFDQYRLFDHDESHAMAERWARETQEKIKENGDWRKEWG